MQQIWMLVGECLGNWDVKSHEDQENEGRWYQETWKRQSRAPLRCVLDHNDALAARSSCTLTQRGEFRGGSRTTRCWRSGQRQ